jgi:hypothetical protein
MPVTGLAVGTLEARAARRPSTVARLAQTAVSAVARLAQTAGAPAVSAVAK